MRYHIETLTCKDLGKTRTVKKFLLVPRHFPKYSNEVRWLEFALIVERVLARNSLLGEYEWVEECFVEDQHNNT